MSPCRDICHQHVVCHVQDRQRTMTGRDGLTDRRTEDDDDETDDGTEGLAEHGDDDGTVGRTYVFSIWIYIYIYMHKERERSLEQYVTIRNIYVFILSI